MNLNEENCENNMIISWMQPDQISKWTFERSHFICSIFLATHFVPGRHFIWRRSGSQTYVFWKCDVTCRKQRNFYLKRISWASCNPLLILSTLYHLMNMFCMSLFELCSECWGALWDMECWGSWASSIKWPWWRMERPDMAEVDLPGLSPESHLLFHFWL